MTYEHDTHKPETFTEDWPGQYETFSWMAYLSPIPHVIFLVTTLKENGLANAALHGWANFNGEGEDYFVVMPVMRHTHTYQNIQRTGEFCLNFLSPETIDRCKETIFHNNGEDDEINCAGLTHETAASIQPPRVKEGFLKLECTYEWEKELCPGGTNILVCGRVRHIAADEDFLHADLAHRYGPDRFTIHLMATKNPDTGERMRGGIGHIEVTREMEI